MSRHRSVAGRKAGVARNFVPKKRPSKSRGYPLSVRERKEQGISEGN